MSCLSDQDICGMNYMVKPFSRKNLQPASYELEFDGGLVYEAYPTREAYYDIAQRGFVEIPPVSLVGNTFRHPVEDSDMWRIIKKDSEGKIYLHPGSFYIASTIEELNIPTDMMARFEGKSSLGRAGLMVHVTAGYVDPGFKGNLTLEIVNVAPWPIALSDGDKIGQLSFHTMSSKAAIPYGKRNNHYQGQEGPTLAK